LPVDSVASSSVIVAGFLGEIDDIRFIQVDSVASSSVIVAAANRKPMTQGI
jgi:hypothetical protein